MSGTTLAGLGTRGFLDRNNIIAVIGVSSDHNKWGWKIYEELKSAGFKVYPINPKYRVVEQDICYPDLKSLPKKPDVVMTLVPPKVTEQVVGQCVELGIKKVWMQPGSESEKAINLCRTEGIELVHDACVIVDGLKQGYDEVA